VDGVVLCQAGRFGGWSLYAKGGRVKYCYNWVGLERYTIAAESPLPAGRVTIRFVFDYDGGGLGKGGKGTLFVNGQKVAEGRIERTNAIVFSGDETADVGVDEATPVTEDYKERDNKFTGKIRKVTIDLK
jgi:arylsulfatase